jgi:hypothetical protein
MNLVRYRSMQNADAAWTRFCVVENASTLRRPEKIDPYAARVILTLDAIGVVPTGFTERARDD